MERGESKSSEEVSAFTGRAAPEVHLGGHPFCPPKRVIVFHFSFLYNINISAVMEPPSGRAAKFTAKNVGRETMGIYKASFLRFGKPGVKTKRTKTNIKEDTT